ncbi:DUF2269 family protein [Desulfococcaceae bacterium HSG7]|nr:DUF2269 family protein [Desulfococcaceae bacterium HSG9]MDM8553426.1 DUF2269 family protein [Desulfococcaceae bacterium HSG7]
MTITSVFYYIIIAGIILSFLALFSYYIVIVSYFIWYFIKENYSLPAVAKFRQKSGTWLKTKGTLWLKGIHLLCGACWAGAAFSMVAVSCLAATKATSDETFRMATLCLKLLDDVIIVPTALASVSTGILFSLLTRWGFFKYYWVAIKWVIAIWSVIFGLFILRPWVNELAAAAQIQGMRILSDPAFQCYSPRNFILGMVQLTLLVTQIFISVLKPWKKINGHL